MTAKIRSHGLWLLWSALFLMLVAIYSVDLDFPIYWHPAEISKADQLLGAPFNFYHPQLMLRLASLVEVIFHLDHTHRGIVMAGRIASVICAASTATLLALFTARRWSTGYGLAAGLLVGLSPLLFEYAHYFKEDAYLLVGIAATMVALQTAERTPTPINVFVLGAAAGLATAGKYIGILMIGPVIALLIVQRADAKHWLAALGGFILVFAVVNFPALLDPGNLYRGLAKEITHVTTNHGGLVRNYTSSKTILDVWRNLPVAILALALAAVVLRLTPFDRTVTAWALALMPLVFLLAVQISVVKSQHYVLPIIVLAAVAAVWACAEINERVSSRPIQAAILASLAIGVGSTVVALANIVDAHVHDHRTQMISWLGQNLPADAVIAADWLAGIPDQERYNQDSSAPHLPQRVLKKRYFVSDFGPISKLRDAGATHVVVASGHYGRFFNENAKVVLDLAKVRRDFYVELFSNYRLLHLIPARGDAGPMAIPRQELRVYDIRPKPPEPEKPAS